MLFDRADFVANNMNICDPLPKRKSDLPFKDC